MKRRNRLSSTICRRPSCSIPRAAHSSGTKWTLLPPVHHGCLTGTFRRDHARRPWNLPKRLRPQFLLGATPPLVYQRCCPSNTIPGAGAQSRNLTTYRGSLASLVYVWLPRRRCLELHAGGVFGSLQCLVLRRVHPLSASVV